MNVWSQHYNFASETVFLATFVMDHYLAKAEIDQREISKLFVTAVLLATKFEEQSYFTIMGFLKNV